MTRNTDTLLLLLIVLLLGIVIGYSIRNPQPPSPRRTRGRYHKPPQNIVPLDIAS